MTPGELGQVIGLLLHDAAECWADGNEEQAGRFIRAAMAMCDGAVFVDNDSPTPPLDHEPEAPS
jgi:hypothetical protein